jgi:hypothetical protein
MGHLTYYVFELYNTQPRNLVDLRLFWAKNAESSIDCIFRFSKFGLVFALSSIFQKANKARYVQYQQNWQTISGCRLRGRGLTQTDRVCEIISIEH